MESRRRVAPIQGANSRLRSLVSVRLPSDPITLQDADESGERRRWFIYRSSISMVASASSGLFPLSSAPMGLLSDLNIASRRTLTTPWLSNLRSQRCFSLLISSEELDVVVLVGDRKCECENVHPAIKETSFPDLHARTIVISTNCLPCLTKARPSNGAFGPP